ncbi:hypothetical protein JCM8208_001305 [Rhodotorula glutinis]
MSSKRTLGPYERFSLARSLAGVAPVVAVTALLPADRVDSTQIASAIDSLLAEYPLLSCAVADVATTEPRFERAAVTASDVLIELVDSPASPARALLDALEAIKDNGVEQAPLWRVWLSAAEEQGGRRVTLAVHHVLSDGSSTRNIFAELLSRTRAPRAAEQHDPAPALPPTLEESVDGTSLKHLSLPSPSLARLNAAAKAHGVATLHPVLYIAFLAALSTVAPRRTTLIGQSPMSLRNADGAPHPPISGNYVCSLETSHGEPAPTTPFWDACATYGARIVDPAERARAKGEMGFLGFLPNEPHVGADESAPQRTTFDAWMENVLRSDEPWKATFEVSNLGVLPATGWEGDGGLDEVLWAQAGMALGPAFAVNAIAVRGGSLAISLTWRSGTVDEATVTAIWEAYERALRRLADGEGAEDATFEDVARAAL